LLMSPKTCLIPSLNPFMVIKSDRVSSLVIVDSITEVAFVDKKWSRYSLIHVNAGPLRSVMIYRIFLVSLLYCVELNPINSSH
jgi:hypothetical protein